MAENEKSVEIVVLAKEQHRGIADTFREEIIRSIEEYPGKNRKTLVRLVAVFRVICKSIKYTQAELQSEIEKDGRPLIDQGTLSRDLDVLNEMLKVISLKKGIEPAIQVFTHAVIEGDEKKEVGYFLACARVVFGKKRLAEEIIPLAEVLSKRNTFSRAHGLRAGDLTRFSVCEAKSLYKNTEAHCARASHNRGLKLVLPGSAYKVDHKKKQNLLDYRYRWPKKLYGRDEELARLLEFAEEPANRLSWWAIIAGGGGGKSRLALEFAYILDKKGWYAGFLDDKEIDVWKHWRPLEPTLIIVDYECACGIASQLGKFICREMWQESRSWEHPLRILFLERHDKAKALEDFRRFNSTIMEDELLYGDGDYLRLGPLSKDAIEGIVSDVNEVIGDSDTRQNDGLSVIRKFLDERVDEPNPLFTLMAAQAYVRNESLQGWDMERLLTKHLEHERRMWESAGIDFSNRLHHKHINMLELATVSQGVDILDEEYKRCLSEAKERICPGDILPTGIEFQKSKYEVLCSNRILGGRLPPIKPDILGELFVLMRCEDVACLMEAKAMPLTKIDPPLLS